MSSNPDTKLYSETEAAKRLGECRIGYYRIGERRVLYSEAEHIRPFLDACNQPPAAMPEAPAPPDSQGSS
jgi:hypothetical protein